jgi:hypothetical protein
MSIELGPQRGKKKVEFSPKLDEFTFKGSTATEKKGVLFLLRGAREGSTPELSSATMKLVKEADKGSVSAQEKLADAASRASQLSWERKNPDSGVVSAYAPLHDKLPAELVEALAPESFAHWKGQPEKGTKGKKQNTDDAKKI